MERWWMKVKNENSNFTKERRMISRMERSLIFDHFSSPNFILRSSNFSNWNPKSLSSPSLLLSFWNSPPFLLHLRLIRRISKQQISGQMESGTRQRNFYKPIGRWINISRVAVTNWFSADINGTRSEFNKSVRIPVR